MKKALLISLILLYSLVLTAQSWQWAKQIGGPGVDRSYIGYVDRSHNIYLYGLYARPYAATDYHNCYIDNDTLFGMDASFLAKYNQNGNLLWVKNCVSPYGIMTIRSFAFDTVNNVFYITGIYNFSCNIDTAHLSTTNKSAFLAKLDENGNCFWAENVGANDYSTSVGTALTIDNNGYIYMAGTTDINITIDTSTVTPGSFLAKFDSDGANLWAKTKFSGNEFQTRMWFQTLKYYNNHIFAAGFPYFVSTNDILRVDTFEITNKHGSGFGILCLDKNTSFVNWLRMDGFPHVDPNGYATSLIDIDGKGNIDFTGAFYDIAIIQQDTLVADSGSEGNSFLLKYDSIGNLLYTKQLHSSEEVGAYGVDALFDGSVLLTGYFRGEGNFGGISINASTPYDLFIARYDSNGNCLGADHAGMGIGLNCAQDESGIYTIGLFPPTPISSGTITIGNNTFTNYGWEDIVFAKHELITGINEFKKENNNSLIIYANPNKGSFRVKIPEDFINEKNLVLNIYDKSGKLIKSQSLRNTDNQLKIDIYGVAAGSYSITISNGRKTYSGTMIVE